MTRSLNHCDILQPGTHIHLARATLTSARPKGLHDHDFFELFWVQNGTLRHHLPDGVETLNEGDIVFLQPGHQHGLQARGDDVIVVSLTIHPQVIKDLVKRYPHLKGHLFWSKGGPAQAYRDIGQLAALNHDAGVLERSRRDKLAAEALLLPLCSDLMIETFPDDTPGWLRKACRAARDMKVFRDGSAGFVAQTGKSHAHVSREMRKHLGLTPSDYINERRMEAAARILITDDDNVSDIAANCGVPNMSHFHKLFRAAHGLTPLQYRQKYQRQIVQPH